MSTSNQQITARLLTCLKDADDLSNISEVCEQSTISNEAMDVYYIALQSMAQRYDCSVNLGLESEETFVEKIKRIAKAIIEAILDTIDKLVSNINYYRLSAESILSELGVIQGRLSGITSIRRRDVTIVSQRLATSLFMTRGGGNIQEAYRRLVTLSSSISSKTNYSELSTLLQELKSSDEDNVEAVISKIKTSLVEPIHKVLTSGNAPSFLKEMQLDSDSTVHYSGPHPGERYIYAIVPNSSRNISGYKVGVFRNMEVIPDRERLPALSANEIWEISKIVEGFAHDIIEFGRHSRDLNRIANLARDIGKDAKSIKAITATAIYPIAVKGILYSTIDMSIDTTKDLLDYCKKSIKAFKEFDSKKKAETEL